MLMYLALVRNLEILQAIARLDLAIHDGTPATGTQQPSSARPLA